MGRLLTLTASGKATVECGACGATKHQDATAGTVPCLQKRTRRLPNGRTVSERCSGHINPKE